MTMRLRTIDAHAAGAGLRLIVEGFPSVKGRSMLDKQRWIQRRADGLRTALLTEPRGHHDLSGALLTEPASDRSVAGLLFMHADGYSAMCGHGLIAAVTIAIERGLIGGVCGSGETLTVDTVAGPVPVTFDLRSGGDDTARRVERVRYRSQAARVVAAGLSVPASSAVVRADVVSADGLYALVDAESAGVPLALENLPELRRAARALFRAMEPVVERSHGPGPRLEGIVFTAPADAEGADLRVVTVYRGLAVDRSPSGGGATAAVVVLSAMGLATGGRAVTLVGLSGLPFRGRVAGEGIAGDSPGLVVEVEGSAHVIGEHTFVLDDDDPLRFGAGWEGTVTPRFS
jgi:trans-L-3-hydroxyproline dehydratase